MLGTRPAAEITSEANASHLVVVCELTYKERREGRREEFSRSVNRNKNISRLEARADEASFFRLEGRKQDDSLRCPVTERPRTASKPVRVIQIRFVSDLDRLERDACGIGGTSGSECCCDGFGFGDGVGGGVGAEVDSPDHRRP